MIKNIKHLFLIITFFCAGMLHAQTTDLIYHLSSSGSTVNVASVATDASGNIYVCGDFTGTAVEFNPLGSTTTLNASTVAGFIASYDATGTLKKAIKFGTTLVNKGLKIYVDPADKNIYLLASAAGSVNFNGGGFAGSVAAGSGSMALIKYDKTLTVKTVKLFNNGTGNAGDILNDLAFYGTDLYVTGSLFSAGVEFNPGNSPSRVLSSTGISDIIVAKYDTTTLTNAWAYVVGAGDSDGGAGIDLDNSGNIYLTGYFTGQNVDIDPIGTKTVSDASGLLSGSTDAFVAKYNTSMACQWAFNIGAGLTDKGNDLLVDKTSGNVYVGGIVKKDALVVYFDPASTTSATFAGVGLNDIFVASYTSAGVYNWHLATGSTGEDELTSLAFDSGNNVVLSGYSSGNVNFGSSKAFTGLGGKDAFFAVISGVSGNATAAYNLGGGNDEQANNVTVASNGKILIVGNYKGAGDYDIGAANSLPLTGTQDGFISRHVLCTPPTITGTTTTCVGSATQLTGSGTASASNAWVSATVSVATVNGSGLVTGISAGTSVITYTNSAGCSQTATVTINAAPTITGTLSVCAGLTTQLTGSGSPAASNPWVSATPSVATINSSGLVTGVSAGTSIITYTNNNGCTKTATVTINAVPSIIGTISACIGTTTQLTGSGTPASSNAWVSATPSVATVNSSGLVTGISAGTSAITYTNDSGCSQTVTVTINAAPTITGTTTACVGSTTQLTGTGTAAASNAWVSATPSVATVNSSGLVTGGSAGTSIITYTNNNGCTKTATVTINAAPIITGITTACVGSTTQLTGTGTAAASNAWVSATPSVATVNSSGLVTGMSAGTSIITYTNSIGCSQTVTVTINASPTITGTTTACVGSTTQLTGTGTAAASNAWVSATPSVATVNSSGLITGMSAGTSIITYTNNNGCAKTATITINATPTITGTATACVGSTTQLTGTGTAAASNAWVSATPSVATVNSSGLITGMSAGTSIITYTNSVGCSQTVTITINASPIITGSTTACVGSTTQLTGTGTAAASNAWVSATPSVATVNSSGLVTGVSAGTSVITYTNSNGCTKTATVTINATPTITGTTAVCVGFTTQLSGSGTPDATAPWVSATTSVATVNGSGLVTGVASGTSIITYKNSNGCIATQTVTVSSTVTPSVSISSTSTNICAGNSITITATPVNGGTPTYKWKLGSTYIPSATAATYTTSSATNNDSYSVEMTSSSSCASPSTVTSNPVVITVNPTLVPTITISAASTIICSGDVLTFTSTPANSGSTPSYVWRKNGSAITPAATGSSYSTTAAQTGDVYSVVMTSNALCAAPLTATSNNITVTVNAIPTITGPSLVCAGSSIILTGSGTANASNPWMSSATTVATVSNSGVVTGVSAGSTDITYTNNNGCSQTITINVIATPTISGTMSVCVGSTTQLTGTGTSASSNPWLSASPSKATVDNTGLVTGIAAGTSIITYTTNAGCAKTTTVTVNALPTITGASSVCVGSTAQLTGSGTANSTSPWSSASAGVATVDNTGLVTGVSAGSSVITYQNSAGCEVTQSITVNPVANPAVSITANNSTICAGTSITFTAVSVDGGTIPVYKWKVGSAYIPGETNSTYTTTSATNGQSYSVEMTSNAICASTSTVNSNAIVISVTTSVTPTVAVVANPGNSICTGTAVTFTATPGNGGTNPTYQWKKNATNISGATTATFTSSTLINGDIISVDMVSNSSCASTLNASSTPITMGVTPKVTPAVSIAASSSSICDGASVTFTATYTNGGTNPMFEWFVNSVSQGAPSSSNTYTSSTWTNNDQVTVKMTSSLACVTNATITSNGITITVTPNVTPAVTITSNKSTICANGSVIYTAVPVNGGTASYQWKINGTNSGSSTSSNTFTTSSLIDGDNVSVVLTSSITCVSSSTAASNDLSITVAPATQIVSQPGDQSVCALGNNVTFSVGAIGDNLTYQWKTGSTNLANNITYSGVTTKDLIISNVSNADLLGYKVTITGTCGTLTSNVANLTQSTTSINIVTQPVSQVLETGEMIQLSVTATGPTLSYQWKKNGVDLVNDSRISGANTASLQISNALVSDSDNNYTCLIMSPCAVQLSTNPTAVTVTTATSTQDALTKGFVIAPNPSSGYFTLTNNYAPFIVEELEIISMEGVVVARRTIAGTTNLNEEVYAQDLPKGMYLLVIKGGGEQALLKVIFDK